MTGRRWISRWPGCLVGLAFLLGWAWPPVSQATDLITFSNGDKQYGKVIGERRGKWIVELNGQELAFSHAAITGFEKDVQPPADIDPLNDRLKPPPGVAQLVQRATGVDVNISVRPLSDGRQLTVIAEKGISVPVVMMGVASSSFFGRLGSYIRGTIRNDLDSLVDAGFDHARIRGYNFLVHVSDAKGEFLGSKRFYLFKFPPGRPVPFTVRFPNFSFERIAQIRVTRRF